MRSQQLACIGQRHAGVGCRAVVRQRLGCEVFALRCAVSMKRPNGESIERHNGTLAVVTVSVDKRLC